MRDTGRGLGKPGRCGGELGVGERGDCMTCRTRSVPPGFPLSWQGLGLPEASGSQNHEWLCCAAWSLRGGVPVSTLEPSGRLCWGWRVGHWAWPPWL